MSDNIPRADPREAAVRVQRFLDERERPSPFAPRGFLPVDLIGVLTRTDDRLLVSDLRALLAALDGAEMDLARGERPECVTCSGRGVWMDEPCADCAPFYCYPCARGDHDEHKLAWVPDIPCECPRCTIPYRHGPHVVDDGRLQVHCPGSREKPQR